ncbi:hypothetical protein ABFS82_11G021300 [Erythranthe guttata]|uniref:WUSCHEL-related homeobox 11-like isoform X2 n=1 Tax=Erythranthe guttata TaxID=4155 RepID=UPI00064DCA9C|nr:PREDICTED: WUSCHEL-related homeobox 11-like isoform X2 [Erythranthe guttata]|eukprot:XP_012857239.1 PREDICTED: WUSCHEL-related homeobox 11-like isoform X2 [Erythranthe guttata]
MEEQRHDTTVSRPSHHHHRSSGGGGAEADHQRILHEPVRSRWTPKPEQILILESIFNSGMVNPPKDETVKIRKLLEKFGSVGDANVFYWFQNRRSRSRRRQRQMQAGLCGGGGGEHQQQAQPRGGGSNGGYSGGGGIHYENLLSGGGGGLVAPNNHPVISYTSSNCVVGSSSSSSSCGFDGNIINGKNNSSDDLFLFSGHPGSVQDYDPNPGFCFAGGASTLNYQPEVITVFINGVATEIGRGAVDMKAVFGGDFVLFHSSGVPVQVNEYGFLLQSLQHGESYFLVPKH